MWFNVFLVIFLTISFLIAFSAIGTVLIKIKELAIALNNVHEVQAKMLEVMRINAEYDNRGMKVLEGIDDSVSLMSKHTLNYSSEVNEYIQDIYDELSKLTKVIDELKPKTVTLNVQPDVNALTKDILKITPDPEFTESVAVVDYTSVDSSTPKSSSSKQPARKGAKKANKK